VKTTSALLVCAGMLCLPAPGWGQTATTVLDRHDFGRRTARFDLPGALNEISGLAITPDGRLFAHDDERARVREIDPRTGEVVKRFSLGDPVVVGDFEGIAVVGERFFLVTSRGLLYEFREMADRGEAPYRVTDTELGAHCEIEGLDYDGAEDVLLFACKVSAPDRGTIVIHRLPLDPDGARLTPIEVSRRQLADYGIDSSFEPSAIAVDPTGTLILISGSRGALIEVDHSGRLIAGLSLSEDRHRQPEGLAFGPDGTLYIADEGGGRDARVTAYARIDGGR
jgi:uncharacterized protein YjiK